MTDIVWTNEKRKLSQLIAWGRNPRKINREQSTRLQESLEEFGQVEPICIGPNNELYNGHQRLKSWREKYGDIEIDVRVASRPLTEKEREKITVFLHKGATGEWDFDALANDFDAVELLEWGFSKKELGAIDFVLPDQSPQREPELKAECLIEIYCSKRDLESFQKTLAEWSNCEGVTVNIS